ncbi:hypothetical protein [Christiangramia sp.]|uniref:hypothetical protein n=1 Tax=Christiangramia sp. TaxID=1931228 RepID=UPI0026327FCE|nr:hypothetical protein [Christiangramia sp.]
MKNIFNLKLIPFLIFGSLFFSACLVDDDIVRDYGNGPNLVGFQSTSTTLTVEVGSAESSLGIPLRLIGPSVFEQNEDVTVEISVGPGSTAEEGVHYRLDSNTVQFDVPGGIDVVTGELPITILTEGINGPLENNPVLNLTITSVSSEADVVINEKTTTTTVTIEYINPEEETESSN